jgi:hypothetical protein
VGLSKKSSVAADRASPETMTLSITIETDPSLFGKLVEAGMNDFVLRRNLVMASIADLDQFTIECTGKWRDLRYGTGSVSDLGIDHVVT